MKTCLYCGSENPDDMLKCFNCGATKFKTQPEDSDKISEMAILRLETSRERYRKIMEVQPNRSPIIDTIILGTLFAGLMIALRLLGWF